MRGTTVNKRYFSDRRVKITAEQWWFSYCGRWKVKTTSADETSLSL